MRKAKTPAVATSPPDTIAATVSSVVVAPPQAAWDPEYLLGRDPRYGHGDGDGGIKDCQGDADSYGDSGGETCYQSDEYTDRGDREDTEDFTESEDDILGPYQQKYKKRAEQIKRQ